MARLPMLLLMAVIVSPLSAQTPEIHAGAETHDQIHRDGRAQDRLNPDVQSTSELSIGRFEQLLAALRGERDAKVARRLAGLTLTERASTAQLARWQAGFSGQRAREALMALADASGFLDLPASDLPAMPPPDAPALKQILNRAIDYTNTTLRKLPDFSALRTTTRFEVAKSAEWWEQQQASALYELNTSATPHRDLGPTNPAVSRSAHLYFMGSSEKAVTYRDGQEVADAPAGKAGSARPPAPGLTTVGEFGPILFIVLGDALRGRTAWSHWEPGPPGPLAVFHYEVPKEFSRYAVESMTTGVAEFPAYHGEIAIEPKSGAILRIAIESNRNPAASPTETGILVEYGPVPIGDKTYISPIHGVAISESRDAKDEGNARSPATPRQINLNDITFSRYHVFRTQIRILPAGGSP